MGTSNYSDEFKREGCIRSRFGAILFGWFPPVRALAHILCTSGLAVR